VPLAPPSPPLSDGVISLRPPSPGDQGWVHAACQDPAIQRWLVRLPTPYTEEDALAWIEECARGWRDGDHASFVIVAPDGEGLGAIGLDVLGGGLGQVGYWVKPEARRRGIASRALALVARWAFGSVGVRRLQLTTHPENGVSQRVAERVGFTREGTLRWWLVTPDGRRDAVMFSLLPGELEGGAGRER
jgi:RimJ/RimL family protein N-acetyltransferase